MKDLEQIIKTGKYSVYEDNYSILKTTKTMDDALASIRTTNEITVIATERQATHTLVSKDILDVDHGWKVISFDMTLPFNLIGFLAKISSSLAENNISIFVISAFSNDLIMVKQDDLPKTQEVLDSMGFHVSKL